MGIQFIMWQVIQHFQYVLQYSTYSSCMKPVSFFPRPKHIVWICIIHWWRRLQSTRAVAIMRLADNFECKTSI